MKRKLFFITFLMLFCTTMFGEGFWGTPVKYNENMILNANIKINGNIQDSDKLEIGAFCGNELRGTAISTIEDGESNVFFTIMGNNGDKISFKLYVPGGNEGTILGTDMAMVFYSDAEVGLDQLLYINFYEKHWNYTGNSENTMTVECTIAIDGVIQLREDLELAAFCDGELRGVAKPEKYSDELYITALQIGGSDGDNISFKLYDPTLDNSTDNNGELSTDYTVTFEKGAILGNEENLTIEFKNNPVARIGEEGNAARYFATLEAAVAAAVDGETIVLLQDVNLTETLTIEKSVTIDGGNYTIKRADESKTYNSAIMVGNSGWGDDHGEAITIKNAKFNNWVTNYGVVRAQGVTLNMNGCEFNECSVSNIAYGVLSLNFADATVENTKFNKNQDKAIDINYNVDSSNAVVTIDGCIFNENTSDGAGIVVRNDGDKLIVKNSQFLNNTVNTTGNAATIYAGWGTQDEVSGCTFSGNTVTTSHATTKRFASAIFCDGCTVTGNAFANNTATRNGETITTTTVAVGAYYGAANISENYWGGNSPVPGVDYTVEYANNNVAIDNYYGKYENGALSEKKELNNVAKAGKYYYESLEDAFAAVQDGETITMLADVEIAESLNNAKNITLDLNGKTIAGKDNTTKNFGLIHNTAELTVTDKSTAKNGKITLVAANDNGFSRYSSVVSNNPGGKLTVEAGTLQHLGGTSMAYAIDNLTNGKGTSAITTIKGGTIESKYIGIRQFLNGEEATNELNITAGSINGENSAIYFQSPSAKANTGKLVITSATPIINNRIYMGVTEGATEWPVEVSIDALALAQGVGIVTSNIPAGYELKEIDGVYRVHHGVAKIGNNYYNDLASALKAITAGCTVEILTDITIASDWDCRNTGAKIGVPVTINGNGKTIKFTGKIYDANWNTLFRFEDVATVKNLTLDASAATDIQRGITFKTSVTVDNCTLIGNGSSARYAVIVGEGAGAENIVNVTANIKGSIFKNWSYGVADNRNGQDMKEFAITDNTFENANVSVSAYEKVTFTGNKTDSDVQITSYTANNELAVTAKENTLATGGTYTVNAGGTLDLQDEFLTPVADVNGKIYFTLQDALNYAVTAADEVTVTILQDVNLTNVDWNPVTVSAPKYPVVTVEGNYKTITGLNDMLFAGTWAGNSGLIIKNLTINGSNIVNDENDDAGNVGVGAFIGFPQASTTVTLENCHLLNSTVKGGHWTGGLIGYAAGYAGTDGPVFMNLTIKGCSVKGSTITGEGSVGGIIGHGSGNAWTKVTITETEVSGNTITSTGTSTDKAGAIVATIGAAGQETTVNGVTHTGGIFVSATVSDNTVKSHETTITTIYGRQGSTGGVLTLTERGSYQNNPIEENVAYAVVAPGFMLEQNENGTYGVVVDPEYGYQAKIVSEGTTTYYATIADAISAAQAGQTVTILDGEYTTDITINKAIIVEGEKDEQGNNLVNITGRVAAYTNATVKYLNVNNEKTGDYDCALAVNGKDIVIDGVNLTGYNTMRYCYATGNITIKNSTINGSNFAVHFDGSEGGKIAFENTDITGWVSYASTVNSVSYTDCDFDQGSYAGHRYYNRNISFTNCDFAEGFKIDLKASGSDVAFKDEDMTVAEVKALFKDPYYVAKGNVTLNGNPVLYAASANNKYYNTLQECINDLPADGTNWYVTLRSDNVLTAPITIPADKKMTFALNGFDITYTSDVQGEAMITNNGVLTIDGSDVDKVAYKFTGTPDTSYGKGNYTIYNNGTLTVESGIVENTTDAMSHASYAINTGAGATLNIKGGKVLNLNGHAVRMVSFGTNVNNVNITGGYIEGTRALQVQLPGDATSTTKPEMNLSISGGELKSNEATYNLAIYVYSNGQSAENFNVNITNGTFNGNVAINEVATKTMKEDAVKVSGGTFNGAYGVFSYADNAVAVPVISITGGTFATDYSEAYALDDGYEFVEDETTGRFGLQQLQGLTISTLHELIAFRNAVNAGNTFEGQTVVLSASVDLAPSRAAAAENWIPIGTKANPFKGTFDGGDKDISNLKVDGEEYVGLFGYADNATIKNVNIVNATVTGTGCVGAIAGNVYSVSLIDNCHVSGSIKIEGQTNVGGIVGKYYTKVTNCSVIGDGIATSYVKGTHKAENFEGDNIGGIMGHAGENNAHSGNIVKNITISGTRKVGGLIGVTDQNTDVQNCLVENVKIETTATAEYAEANIAKAGHGAIVGSYTKLGENNNGTVENCVVKDVVFVNDNNVKVSFGPITGGAREGMIEPTGVTASGNLIYMSTITGVMNNYYLMNAVAKIGETKYYTLQDAVDAGNGKEINVIASTTENIAIAENANITLEFDENVVLNGYIAPFQGKLTIKGGTINNTNGDYSAIEINAGELVLNGVNIASARHAVRIDGNVEATIDGGKYTVNATSGTRHAVNVSDGANVTIKTGTFVGPKGTTMDSGSAVCVQANSKVTIEGGDFSGGKNATLGVSGTMIVKGGTFDQDVTAYCADGYVCQMNADGKYEVFFAVAEIGEVKYPSLQEAFNDVKSNETITIISNVEEDEVILPVALNNVTVTALENVVVKNTIIKTPEMNNASGFAIAYESLTFNNVNFDNSRVYLKGWANNALSQSVSIKNLVVTNCVFNNIANGENENYAALHLNVADGELENLTFTNNKVNGITGGESAALYGNFTGDVTITGNVIRNTSGSSMVVGYSNATVIIKDNILENWAVSGKGRAIRLSVNNEANASTVVVEGNAMIRTYAPEEFVKSTGSNTTVTLNENYWNGNSPREKGMVTAEGVVIDNYYETCTVTGDDFVLDNLVVYAKGTITHGYVNTYRIWGEGSSNSQKSFVVKVYAGETLLGQASLKDIDNIIDGDIPNVTWGIPYNAANTDEYWTVEWFEALSPSVVPTTVKLYVDGECVAENTIKMSAPDDVNPIEWEDIFVAKIEETGTHFTSLQAAIDAATTDQTVVVLDNITLTETLTVAADDVVTLDLNGKTVTGTPVEAAAYAVINNKGNLTITDNTAGKEGKIVCNHTLAGSTAYAVNTILNGGTLEVLAGTIENTSTSTNQIGYAIDNNSTTGNAVVVIEGGVVKASGSNYYDGIRQYCNSETNSNDVTISGGEVSTLWLQNPSDSGTERNTKDVKGSFVINGGTLGSLYLEPSTNFTGSITAGHVTSISRFETAEGRDVTGFITGGTFGMDVNAFCHEYYDAVTEDNITWTVEQVLFAQTRAFTAGWNWFSSYINLSKDNGLGKLQNAIAVNYENGVGSAVIKGQTDNQSSQYGYVGTLEGVDYYQWTGVNFAPLTERMYMINTSEAIAAEDFLIEGEKIDYENTTIALFQGWNWISYPLDEPTLINDALKNLETAQTGDQIKWYGNGFAFYSNGKWNPENFTMQPGQGYMYKAAKSGSFTYSKGTEANRGNVNSNMTVEDNHWIPAISEYANNMTITAMLSIDNEIVNGEYEIAAFANGECRGSARPIYIEELNVYILLMTVFGDDVEELTFKYYDVNYGTEYELGNRLNYSNDAVVGSIDEPYMFNLNILNIEENSIDQISIYPNPTTTNSEINLQAMCDKVEVFNALGVKVAEYSNVDSIDALETAGIYVIRVTIDGNARNCRLVVK